MGEFIGLVAVVCIFGTPIVAIITNHYRKLAEMRMQSGAQGNSVVVEEMQKLKQQMAELRDTTTRYDISFDAALQRIESRVGHLENKVSAIEQAPQQARIER